MYWIKLLLNLAWCTITKRPFNNPYKRASIDVYVFPGDRRPSRGEVVNLVGKKNWWRRIQFFDVTNYEEMYDFYGHLRTAQAIVVTSSAPEETLELASHTL